MAEREVDARARQLFRDLALAAEQQATQWLGHPAPDYRPDLRSRIAAALVRRLGVRPLAPVLTALKIRGLSIYTQPGHAMPSEVQDIGGRHRTGGGNLRAAVFGVNDGLVSNASLILGVAGAGSGNTGVLIAGVAGLLAGAFSMAAGEYVSVRSQREMYEHQIALERAELGEYPNEEAAELALIYAARGVPKPEAEQLAQRLIADPEKALDALTREELGLNPADLGSPIGAASASFLSFAGGAALPLLPFLLFRDGGALAWSIVVTALALFGVGAAISLFTGRNAALGGARMLAIGAAAGAATFGIGRALGVGLT